MRTGAGTFQARRLDEGRVAVELPAPAGEPRALTVEIDGKPHAGFHLLVGVPHFVLPWGADLGSAPVRELGQAIRRHSVFTPAGTNVNFVRFPGSPETHRMEIRTYERGVEDETLSCGTGVLASAAGELISELERSLVSPERFAAAMRAWGSEDPRRAAYARDVGALYLAYGRQLERLERVDSELFAWRSLDALRQAPARWGSEPVFLYGFDDLHPLERDAIETLELALFRGTRPQAGSSGLADDFARFRSELGKLRNGEASSLHNAEPRVRLKNEELDRAARLIAALQKALAPLENLSTSKPHDFAELAHRHREVLIALSRNQHSMALAFEEPAGLALASAFDDLLGEQKLSGMAVPLNDYPEVFQTAFADRAVRRVEKTGARLHIYGPLESRLMQANRVIVGGLIEGVWPPTPRIDPWLSRPMRHELGLDLPERRIGLSAHDFAQLLGAENVILSHSAKAGGAPAVASRFLHRLEAVAGAERWEAAKLSGEKYLRFAHQLDRPATVEPVPQPAPTPPRATRPLKMSVTAIEDWLRDPYTIYARYILRLDALDPVDMPLSAADRGSAIHDALGEFTKSFANTLPDDPAHVLGGIGEKYFLPLMERPEARALWWPRFLRIAQWFAAWEIARRGDIQTINAEIRGEIAIALDHERTFILSARADRIERRRDGSFAILDYKTGQPPTGKQVRMGLSPQLTLEAAILREGGFAGIAADSSVGELAYVRLSGNNPPGEQKSLELKIRPGDQPQPPDAAAAYARAQLETLIRKFENEDQAYTSLNLPMWTNRYGTYDDLARIKEWSAAGGLGIEEW